MHPFVYLMAMCASPAEQRAAYDRYVVPESRGVPTASLGAAGNVNFKKAHPPLLITAGEKDHIVPSSLNQSNYKKYQGASVTAIPVLEIS